MQCEVTNAGEKSKRGMGDGRSDLQFKIAELVKASLRRQHLKKDMKTVRE